MFRGLWIIVAAGLLHAQAWKPVIPKTWEAAALAGLHVPLAHAPATPTHVATEYYYRIPVRTLYQSYPVYHPDREPPGYLEKLGQQEPEAFDAARLKTQADWVKAGELVFLSPLGYSPLDILPIAAIRAGRVPVTAEGIVGFSRYVVRKKGQVEWGVAGCGFCHTRVLPDRPVIQGAQGNVPTAGLLELPGGGTRWLAPWLRPDPNEPIAALSVQERTALRRAAMPAGVQARHSGLVYPVATSDLIGVKDRRYFDRTGFIRHRTIGDLMRYAALVTGMDVMDRFGDYEKPALPDSATLSRYSDEQLYALALYLYSLQPPPNPNKPDALSARGKTVFEREGCAGCHTPPLYTNNTLTPAQGFTVPEDHQTKFNVMP
ncbi:MAG: hypothetical protein ACRD8O_23315, partial [Bryobacteraceae bacterium]